MKGLETGHVPGERVYHAINTALKIEAWHDGDEALMPLTKRWEILDALRMIGNGRHKWIEFDFADQLLCVLGLQDLWRDGLEDIYLAVNLEGKQPRVRRAPKGFRRCARVGCNEVFPRVKSNRFEKRYCSGRCQQADWKNKKLNERTRLARRYDTCPNGHDRSGENVAIITRRDGSTRLRCRECERLRARRRYERMKQDPTFMERKRQRERAYYHATREAV